jgi:hypothetical protein
MNICVKLCDSIEGVAISQCHLILILLALEVERMGPEGRCRLPPLDSQRFALSRPLMSHFDS